MCSGCSLLCFQDESSQKSRRWRQRPQGWCRVTINRTQQTEVRGKHPHIARRAKQGGDGNTWEGRGQGLRGDSGRLSQWLWRSASIRSTSEQDEMLTGMKALHKCRTVPWQMGPSSCSLHLPMPDRQQCLQGIDKRSCGWSSPPWRLWFSMTFF